MLETAQEQVETGRLLSHVFFAFQKEAMIEQKKCLGFGAGVI